MEFRHHWSTRRSKWPNILCGASPAGLYREVVMRRLGALRLFPRVSARASASSFTPTCGTVPEQSTDVASLEAVR